MTTNYPGIKSFKAYLNTPACGLISTSAREAAAKFNLELNQTGSQRADQWRFEEQPRLREAVAEFLEAPKENIAFIPNFSFGLISAVHSWRGPKRVLLIEDDYPSLTLPFEINGFEITWVKPEKGFAISEEEIEATLLEKEIPLLAISHVQWLSGYKLDIDRLGKFCQEHGIAYIVDTTQSMGAVPVSFQKSKADLIICSNYKWMNAGFGTGLLVVSDRWMENHPPALGGFASLTSFDGAYEPSPRSYEPGHTNMAGLVMLEEAIREKMEIGLGKIASHNARLVQAFMIGLAERGIDFLGTDDLNRRSGILCFSASEESYKALVEARVQVSYRRGKIRIGTHFYNSESEIEQFFQVLDHLK